MTAVMGAAILLAATDAQVAVAQDKIVIDLTITSTPTETTPARSTSSQLTLQDLVDEALKANLQIGIERTRIRAAEALYGLAAAQVFPKGRVRGLFGGPTPEAKTTVTNDITTVTSPSLEGDFDFGDLGVSFRVQGELIQPLFTFGKIDAAKDAAGHLVKAAEHNVTITSAEVVMNVHRAYWAYHLTRSFVESLTDGERILTQVLEKVEELLENDSPQVTENDRLRLIHAQSTVRVRLAEVENATELAGMALRLLIGRDQGASLELAPVDFERIGEQGPPLAKLLDDAIELRPELAALREVVAATKRFADFRTNQFWPTFFLGGFLNYSLTTNATDQTNPFIEDPYNFFEAGIGLGVQLDLDWFDKYARLEQARAEADERIAQSAAAAQAIDLEVRAKHTRVASLYKRLGLLERAHRAARGWLNASVLGYDIGTGDAGELIDAFIARATAEGELKKTFYDIHLGMADLQRVSGRLVSGR